MNLGKNSFTILETILSLTILIILIGGFKYSTYYDKKSDENFMLLNSLENSFDTKNYLNFFKTTQNLTIIKNHTSIETLKVTKYEYSDENIKLFKYEK